MAARILTVGLELASDDVQHEEFTSRVSLLDWDIVLFRPVIDEFISSYGEEYKGKPSLSDSSSFQLKESCEHWRREIKQAIDAGKSVIVFLVSVQEVYIDTGDRQFSGTGRNQRTTRIVTPYTNYKCIPATLGPTTAKGNAIKLSTKGAEILAPYWSEFSGVSEYNVILLPDIDFSPKHFFTREGKKTAWTTDAIQFAARMLSAVVSLDAALHSSSEVTPEPLWAADPIYSLNVERRLRVELLDAERRLEEAQKRKEELLETLKSAGRLRGLLFEKGKPLEAAIIDALQLMGFRAQPYKDAASEFDVVFESAEGRLIGEAEGKDNRAVNIDKLRQLSMNIHEDLQREEVATPAKAVLFGNGYRLQPIAEREAAFTEKCISAALAASTALVATADLFRVAQHLADQQDQGFATQCRQAMLGAVGIVKFPELPPRQEAGEADTRE
jgi:hypothetical protein